jgi:hypothetical protein
LSVLVVLVSAGFSSPGGGLSPGAKSALSQLAAHNDVLLKPPAKRSGAWADGAIDSFEEDDLDCEQLAPTPSERAASAARHDFRIPFFTSADLARPHPARGPPSA